MDVGVWEVKYEHRDDCVNALAVSIQKIVSSRVKLNPLVPELTSCAVPHGDLGSSFILLQRIANAPTKCLFGLALIPSSSSILYEPKVTALPYAKL